MDLSLNNLGREAAARRGERERLILRKQIDSQFNNPSSESILMSNSVSVSEDKPTPKWEPENWAEVLANIRESHNNPSPGKTPCSLCIDGFVSPMVLRYQALVSLVLKKSSEEKSLESAMLRLRKHGLTIQNIVKTDEKLMVKLIYPLSLWQEKALNIKRMTQILHDEHQDDLPISLEKLLKLPGVDPKMALICMNFSRHAKILNTQGAIVAKRLGWVKESTNSTAQVHVSAELQSWLPLELQDEAFHLLEAFSVCQCQVHMPSCADCPNKAVCPYGRSKLGNLDVAEVTCPGE